MRYALILVCSVLTIILHTSCARETPKSQNQEEIVTQTSPTQVPEFDIKFPETEFEVKKTETRNESIDNVLVTNITLMGAEDDKPFMYFVAYNEITKSLKDVIKKEEQEKGENPTRTFLQSMSMSSAVKLGGKDFKFTDIKLENYVGVESTCKVFDEDGFIKSRAYIIDDYIFMVSAGGQQISSTKVDAFLNSFAIKKNSP